MSLSGSAAIVEHAPTPVAGALGAARARKAARATPGGNKPPLPFQPPLCSHSAAHTLSQGLRTASPTVLPASCGTLLHVGSQDNSLEYLLLTPRSALGARSERARAHPPPLPPRLLTHSCSHEWDGISLPLQRHPFSGLLHSVGELLRTP